MSNPWKWIAIGLGIAFVCLLVFTILVVNGLMDLGMSVL